MSEPVAFKYRAFISYSHADQDWAKWLHRAVESFPIGKDLAGRFTERGEIYWTLRGGAWNFPAGYLTASFCSNVLNSTATRLSFYGFRVAPRALSCPLLLAPLRALM